MKDEMFIKKEMQEVLYTEDLKQPELLTADSGNKPSACIACGWECGG